MTVTVEEVLRAKSIEPGPGHLPRLEAKWANINQLKGDLSEVPTEDADIALRNIAGGDHIE